MRTLHTFEETETPAIGEYRHYRVGNIQSIHEEIIEGEDTQIVTYELVETHRREQGGPLRRVEQ